ncbi:hypothetical protein P12x_001515 [Tundrisphaera lichenicola]|uniref:hypothetical protein n=1 Tax=Tundrisphaera lichenicola TaxID=2029860 RepID=UPI003EBD55F5
MITQNHPGFRPAFLASLSFFACLGCGDDTDLGKRYPVKGMVIFKQEPVKAGTINFIPTSPDGRPASGEIVDGYYTLTTLAPNDGALPGKYKVTVVSKVVDTKEMEAIAKGGQFHHDKTFLKATKNAKSLVPSKYSLADTSGLEKEVKEESNKIDFELTE